MATDDERGQGREPIDTSDYRAWMERLLDLDKELEQARCELAKAEKQRPAQGIWLPHFHALVWAGIVFALSYVSLPVAISAAVYCVIIETYGALDWERRHSDHERRHCLAVVSPARRKVEELERRHTQLLGSAPSSTATDQRYPF
jgi:hypothetical protein